MDQWKNRLMPTGKPWYKDGVSLAWTGLITALEVLRDCSDWNPKLKSAAGGTLALIGVAQVHSLVAAAL